MKRARLTRKDLEENSHAKWNAFVELLAMTPYEDLALSQRPAYLVFWYESEVQNGGHLQYFINWSDQRGDETVQSLRALGADLHARILEQAVVKWRAGPRPAPVAAEEYAAIALEGEFDDLDRDFYESQETLVSVLMRHLSEHEAEFIVRE